MAKGEQRSNREKKKPKKEKIKTIAAAPSKQRVILRTGAAATPSNHLNTGVSASLSRKR